MIGIEIFIELFTALIIVNLLAERFKAPSPILLLLCGVGLGFWEEFSTLSINPELIFTFILPPLIYLTAFYTSWNEMLYNKRIMFFLAIGLVVATALGVGWITQSMIPGFTLPLGILLGAIIAPPDAIAASSIIRKLNVPRRVLTVLEGEALLNDATSLVIYRFALTTLFTGYFSLNEMLSHFILICVGSILYGLIAGYIISIIRHRENRMNIEVSLSLLTPFLLYLPVEAFHGSGIISTVVGGIFLGYKSPKMLTASARINASNFWGLVEFWLQGMLFLITGIQFPQFVKRLEKYPIQDLLFYAVIVCLAVIVIRVIYVFTFAYLPRLLDKALRERDPYPPWQNILIISWSGMRGIVSLAAALAIPFTCEAGKTFPERDLVIFLTFSVIFGTLVLQGGTLTFLIKSLKLQRDMKDVCSVPTARMMVAEKALEHLHTNVLDKYDNIDADTPFIQRLIGHYEDTIEKHSFCDPDEQDPITHIHHAFRDIELEMIEAERDALIALRNNGEIHDETLHMIERELDLRQVRLQGVKSH